jgi:gas vesicle protein
MNETTQQAGDYRFVLGLFTGTFVGAGLAMWLAPRAVSGVRDRVTRLADSARSARHEASETYQRASTRVAEMLDDVTQRGRDVRDDIAGVVARGAHEVAHGALEVERVATATTRRRVADAKPSV